MFGAAALGALGTADAADNRAEAATHDPSNPSILEQPSTKEPGLDISAIGEAIERGETPVIDQSMVAEVADGVQVADAGQEAREGAVLMVAPFKVNNIIEQYEAGELGFTANHTQEDAYGGIMKALTEEYPELMENEDFHDNMSEIVWKQLHASDLPPVEEINVEENFWSKAKDWDGFRDATTQQQKELAEMVLGRGIRDEHPSSDVRMWATEIVTNPGNYRDYENMLKALEEYHDHE